MKKKPYILTLCVFLVNSLHLLVNKFSVLTCMDTRMIVLTSFHFMYTLECKYLFPLDPLFNGHQFTLTLHFILSVLP